MEYMQILPFRRLSLFSNPFVKRNEGNPQLNPPHSLPATSVFMFMDEFSPCARKRRSRDKRWLVMKSGL